MKTKTCRDCKSILNDRRYYPAGWDRGLCESCNELYEMQGSKSGYKKLQKHLKEVAKLK